MSISKFWKEAVAYRLGGGHAADHAAMGTGMSSISHSIGAIGDSITGNCVTANSLLATIGNGGSGFVVNDNILLPNNVNINVTAVGGGGAVTTCAITNSGNLPYTAQASAQAQIWTTGVGVGFTATLSKQIGNIALMAKGYVGWAQTLSNCAGIFLPQNVWGFPGKGTLEILSVLPLFIAQLKSQNCNTAVVEVGTNDLLIYGRSFATTTNLLTQIWSTLYKNGIRVIVVPILPRSSDGAGNQITAANTHAFLAIAQWSITYCRDNPGMYLADPSLNLVDLTSTTGFPIPYTTISTGTYTANSYTLDGLHPSIIGSKIVGQSIATILQQLNPTADTRMVSPADAYDAINNPHGNLLANGLCQTFTSGMANSWGTVRYIGSAGTCVPTQATVSLANGLTYNQQQLVISTLTDAATAFSFYQTLYAYFYAGDTVYAECEITVTAASGQFSNVSLGIGDGTQSTRTLQETAGSNFPGAVAGGATWSGVLRTPPMVVQSGATQLQFQLYLAMGGVGVVGTVTVGRMAIRKI